MLQDKKTAGPKCEVPDSQTLLCTLKITRGTCYKCRSWVSPRIYFWPLREWLKSPNVSRWEKRNLTNIYSIQNLETPFNLFFHSFPWLEYRALTASQMHFQTSWGFQKQAHTEAACLFLCRTRVAEIPNLNLKGLLNKHQFKTQIISL